MHKVAGAALLAASLFLPLFSSLFPTPLIPFAATAAHAQDAALQDEALDDAVIKLEADLKEEVGPIDASPDALKAQAEAALAQNDFAGAERIYAQILTTAPNDSQSWRRYSDILLRVQPGTDRSEYDLQERAVTAAYIAYRRATDGDDQADALITLGNAYGKREEWRKALDALKLALSIRESESLRNVYTQLREKYGFRVTNFTVDSDASSPRACFQFSEALPDRVDFEPYVAVAGQDKPAISVDDQQLCVEGLHHGDAYRVSLREGLPSTVDEALLKTAEFDIYVRDRAPFVRISGKAYVLPKTGQQGIPLVSVNTEELKVSIYRIGDRNLIDAVFGAFRTNLYPYLLDEIRDTQGQKVWTGSLAVQKELNQDVTTNFPVTEAVPEIERGVYILAAAPESQADDEWGERATQWFVVSDLGLTAYSSDDGIHAFVNSLASTDPVAGVSLKLIARNNEILATLTTDENGRADFGAGLARGEGGLSPSVLVASRDGTDYAFLSLKQSPFDLTDRGVEGRDPPGALDAFVFTERGVYRTGETVHLTALLRDAGGTAVAGTPLTLVISRPDGVEYRRSVVGDEGLGGRDLDVPIIAAAPTGTYRVEAFADPKGAAIGETSFLVEDYVPDRLEFDLATEAKTLTPGTPAEITLDGRYLYGAPAAGLSLEGEMRISQATERPGFEDYYFGAEDADGTGAETEVVPLVDLPQTDAKGAASFPIEIDAASESTHPMEAKVIVRMAELGGRAVERDITLPLTPAKIMIGVKPLFEGGSLGEGEPAAFDVVMVSPEGEEMEAPGLEWQLLQIDSKYQWYRQDGAWQYEPVKITRRIANGTIDVKPGAPAKISVPVSWGRYRLEVATKDPAGPQTTYGFDAGYYAEASADTPDLLEVALDKEEYSPGEEMTVAVTARSAGKVMLSVIGSGKLLASSTADVEAGTVKLPLKVEDGWGMGAYVVATLLRPLEQEAKRMPGRAMGLAWFSIDKRARTLDVSLDLPEKIRPESTLTIPIKLGGLAAGQQARLVVSAVDVGILNLTDYEPPAPTEYYLGQRKLSAEIRDLYGQLIDGMQGSRGAIRTGGDGGAGVMGVSAPTQPPLALYSGIVTVGEDGIAEVSFEIPAFSGTARVMAVAWSDTQVGEANGDVIIRDPVVLTATLPRFLLTGDKSTLRLDLDNVEGAAGDYDVLVSTEGPVAVASAEKTIALKEKQRSGISLALTAGAVGQGSVTVTVQGPDDYAVARRYALDVKPANQILSRRTVSSLAPGEGMTITSEVFADLVPGTGNVALSVTPWASLDVATLIASLDRYPLGCTEQIISRAMPLLYVNELSVKARLAADTAIEERLAKTVETVLARQSSEGGFGLWSPGSGDPWLDAYVTDFLTRAREQGFSVPEDAFRLALNRLRNSVSTAPDVSRDGGLALSYALYVLARNGTAPVGDLRYIADTKLGELGTPMAKAEIGAALAMLGDRIRAEKAFNAALGSLPEDPRPEFGRVDFGSPLRDAAAVVTLAAEGGAPKPLLISATAKIGPARSVVTRTSTQEDAWLILAAKALDQQKVSLTLNGEAHSEPVYETADEGELAGNPIAVGNQGETPVDAVLDVSGSPVSAEPAVDQGFHIERSYFSLDGTPADPSKARQNERFVVLIRVTEPKPQFARVALIDYLPAGFEIDNPHLVSSGETSSFGWITDGAAPVHQSFRDDRFTAAFDRTAESPSIFSVAYVVRAVSPGEYVLPQAIIEDMYARDRYGQTGTGRITVQAAR